MRRLVGLALITTGVAHAADVDRFEPAGSTVHGHGTLQGESPFLGDEGIAAGLLASFFQDPVVRIHPDGQRSPEVATMLPLTLYGGYTWAGRARFEAFVPVYGWVDAPLNDYRGPSFGDVRLQANIPLVDDDLVMSIVPRLGLPTGSDRSVTRRGAQGSFLLALAHDIPSTNAGLLANVGFTGSPRSDIGGVALGSTFDALVGAWWNTSERFRVGTEIDLRAGLVRGDQGGSTTSTWNAFAQALHPAGIGMTVGGGTSLLSDVGAPEYRAYTALTYVPPRTERDRDGDGIGDFMDRCPEEPEDLDGFEDHDGCPDPDNDGDGLSDALDLCPDHAGPAATRGCPDTDADGLSDADDLCPTLPGPEVAGGCPDADDDRVADYRDACPDEPGPDDELLDFADGCPKPVWLAEGRVGFTGRLPFVTHGAVLRPTAQPSLTEIAAFLVQTPELLEIEIQGHVDDTMEEEPALALTQARAEAVRQELARHGVDPGRLVAKGYGKTQPVDTNRTEAGRSNNRRVELHILRQEPITPPEWPPPPGVTEGGVGGSSSVHGVPGTLEVRILGGGWADVFVDGERLPLTAPFTAFDLAPGPHEIRVTNREDIEHTQAIQVVSGEHLLVEVAPVGLAPEADEDARPEAFDGSFPLFPEGKDTPFDGNFPLFPEAPDDDAEDEAGGKKKKRRKR